MALRVARAQLGRGAQRAQLPARHDADARAQRLHLVHAATRDRLPRVERGWRVEGAALCVPVRRDEHAALTAERAAQRGPHAAARGHVDAGGGLVQQRERRAAAERGGGPEAPRAAAAVPGHVAPTVLLQTCSKYVNETDKHYLLFKHPFIPQQQSVSGIFTTTNLIPTFKWMQYIHTTVRPLIV